MDKTPRKTRMDEGGKAPAFLALPEYAQYAFREQRESIRSFEEMISSMRKSCREMRVKAILLAYGVTFGSKLKNIKYPGNRIYVVIKNDDVDGSISVRWTGEGDNDPQTGKPRPPALAEEDISYESIFSDSFGTRWELVEK